MGFVFNDKTVHSYAFAAERTVGGSTQPITYENPASSGDSVSLSYKVISGYTCTAFTLSFYDLQGQLVTLTLPAGSTFSNVDNEYTLAFTIPSEWDAYAETYDILGIIVTPVIDESNLVTVTAMAYLNNMGFFMQIGEFVQNEVTQEYEVILNSNEVIKYAPNAKLYLKFLYYNILVGQYVAFDSFENVVGVNQEDIQFFDYTTTENPQMLCTTDVYSDAFALGSENADIVINAKVEGAEGHTVNFIVQDYTYYTTTVADGGTINPETIPDPTVTGKEFLYWALNGVAFDFTQAITSDLNLDAVFQDVKIKVKYRETLASGAVRTKTVNVVYGSKAPNKAPVYVDDGAGNEFVYWALDGQPFDFSTPITEAITLDAVYMKGGNSKWVMSLDNCFVGLKSDIADLPIARVANGTKALALSETSGEEAAYIFHKASYSWIELQHYTVNL